VKFFLKIFDNYSIVIKSQGNNRDNMMMNNKFNFEIGEGVKSS